jgi:transcriptional regulator with XRE-family HTH domain
MHHETLAAMLRDAGLSHAEAARRIGIAERSLRRMLAGERELTIPMAELRRRLADRYAMAVCRHSNAIDTYHRLDRLAERYDQRAACYAAAGAHDACMEAWRRIDSIRASQRGCAWAILHSVGMLLSEVRFWAGQRGMVRTELAVSSAIAAYYDEAQK